MSKRTYLYQEELDRLMNYLKGSEKNWLNYYFIIYNMVTFSKPFNEMKKVPFKDMVFPKDIPVPTHNPFDITLRSLNKQIKIASARVGIRDVNITTKLFSKKFLVGGIVCYGVLKESKNNYSRKEYGCIYCLKHSHRNPEISKLFTDKKIGRSIDYDKRVKTITLGPVGVELIKKWEIPTSKLNKVEKTLHSEFRERNIIGEWFDDPNNELCDKVEQIIMNIL
jgi:hypothetical protein